MIDNLSRRRFVGLSAAAVGGVAGLAACGGGNSNTAGGGNNQGNASDMGTGAPTAIGGNVTWASWANPGEAERFKWYAQQYQKKYGTKVTFQVVVGDYQSKLMTQLAGGSAADVFYVGDGSMSKLVETGKLTDLSEYLARPDARVKKDDIFPGLYEWCSPKGDGKLYGLPVDCNPSAFWYNSDMLATAKVDKTPAQLFEEGAWTKEALDEMLAKVKATGKRAMVLEAGWGYFFEWITTFGGTLFDEGGKGKAVFDQDEKAMKVFEWLWKGMDDGTITYAGSLPKGQGVDALFYAQQVATNFYGRWILPNLKKLKFKYDIAPFPSESGKDVMPTPIFTAALSVNSGAKEVEPALAFFGNYVNQDGQRARLSGGGNAVPAIKGLENIVTEGNPTLPEHAKYFNDLAAKGYAIPLQIARNAEVATNLGTVMDGWIKSKISAKDFATKLANYINTGKK